MNFQRIKILTQDSKQIISEKELQIGELALLLGTNKLYTKNKSGELVDLSGATDTEVGEIATNYFNKTTDDLDDIVAGAINKHFTDTEKNKLGTIHSNADVTSAAIGPAIWNSTEDNTPSDGDRFALSNDPDQTIRHSTWAAIKSTLKTYFDTLYGLYSEGSFTPTYSPLSGAFSSITYGMQLGRYIKIGKLVHVQIRISTNEVVAGTEGSVLRIAGLPFTPLSLSNLLQSISIGSSSGFVNNPLQGFIISGSAFVWLQKRTTFNGNTTNVNASGDVTLGAVANANQVALSINYISA